MKRALAITVLAAATLGGCAVVPAYPPVGGVVVAPAPGYYGYYGHYRPWGYGYYGHYGYRRW